MYGDAVRLAGRVGCLLAGEVESDDMHLNAAAAQPVRQLDDNRFRPTAHPAEVA